MNIFKKIITPYKWCYGLLNSPFKVPRIHFTFGPIQHGTPYFLPRRWKKPTEKELFNIALEHSKKDTVIGKKNNALSWARLKYKIEYEEYKRHGTKPIDVEDFISNSLRRDYPPSPFEVDYSFAKLQSGYIRDYMFKHKDSKHAVDIKYFGVNAWGLGWKTKWNSFRFEYNPGLSVVIFGKQLLITILPPLEESFGWDLYWEAFLTYRYETNRNNNTIDRLFELFTKFSASVTGYDKEEKYVKDYFPFILKQKHLNRYNFYHEYLKPINETT